MREPILSLTDSPETPSLFLSHSAIIWRKPGEGRGWKKGWKRNRWNFRASRHNARRISLTRLGKQEKNALISRPLPPPSTPSFVPGQYERCAGKRISSRFPLSYPPFSPPLFFFPSLPFSNPSAFALVPISIELSYGKQFLLTILHSILLHTLRIFFFSFFFSIGLQSPFSSLSRIHASLIRSVQELFEYPPRKIDSLPPRISKEKYLDAILKFCIDKIISNDHLINLFLPGHGSFQFRWTVVKNGMDGHSVAARSTPSSRIRVEPVTWRRLKAAYRAGNLFTSWGSPGISSGYNGPGYGFTSIRFLSRATALVAKLATRKLFNRKPIPCPRSNLFRVSRPN